MPLNKKEISNLLNKEEIVYLSTSSNKAEPHLKPIWFVIHNDEIWFETHLPTVAFKNIKENNRVVLCFGGKETYIVWGSVEWFEEKDAPLPFRKIALGEIWKRYGR